MGAIVRGAVGAPIGATVGAVIGATVLVVVNVGAGVWYIVGSGVGGGNDGAVCGVIVGIGIRAHAPGKTMMPQSHNKNQIFPQMEEHTDVLRIFPHPSLRLRSGHGSFPSVGKHKKISFITTLARR
jgi:hypothetical protein